jgi:glycosyltransferase involved in cell wall biosynthesis
MGVWLFQTAFDKAGHIVNAPLRVAFDGRNLAKPALRGMDRYLIGLLRHLPEFGVEPTVFYREREPIPACHRDGCSARFTGLFSRSGIWWEQWSVPKAVLLGRFDLYHSPAERLVPVALPCPRIYSLHSVTDLSYEHLVRTKRLPGRVEDYLGHDPAREKRKWGQIYHDACVRFGASHIITVSNFARREIIDLYRWPANRISITPLGLAAEFTRPRKPDADLERVLAARNIRGAYLLSVGGYERHKNPLGLLEAYQHVRKHRPELGLVMVGTGRVPDEIEAARLAMIGGDGITLLSNLTDELVDLYDGAALFVSLSWRETFGLPALEAMSRGLGVVASNWGATPEVMGDAGRGVDPRDQARAAEVILDFLTTVPTARRAELARQRAGAFTWRETARLTADIYRHVLGHKQAYS